MSLDRLFLDYSVSKLQQLESRIEDCLDSLTDEQIWTRGSEAENAVGNLVLHLSGNLRQWILTGVAGLPDIRNRDREFAARGDISASELKERIRGTVADTVEVLENLSAERLEERMLVQKYDVSILEGIYHVVEHFSQHTGQIIFATKLLTAGDLGFYKHLKDAQHREKTP